MEVITLGTGNLVPQNDRASASVAVVEDGQILVIDLGRNALSRMVGSRIEPFGLDQILLTHLHPDHSCELVSLLFGLNHGVEPPRSRGLRLVGPAGLRALVGRLQEAWPWLAPRYPLEVDEIGPGPVSGLAFEVVAVGLEHGNTENLGYRVRSPRTGRVMAFTGDTGPCAALLELARGVDLLVAECAQRDANATAYHLSPASLGAAARAAAVGHLVITHLDPRTDPAEVLTGVCQLYRGRVTLARDGMRTRIEG